MDEREPTGVAWWIATLMFTALMLYPLSAGPVLRLYNEELLPESSGLFFVPLLIALERAPEPVQAAFETYTDWWLWREESVSGRP